MVKLKIKIRYEINITQGQSLQWTKDIMRFIEPIQFKFRRKSLVFFLSKKSSNYIF